jgi:hypothetical protein
MTTKKLVGSFVLALASASLFYACSSSTSDPAEPVAKSTQAIIYDGNNNTDDVFVGEAFTHEDTPSPHGYDYTCLTRNADVEFAPYGNQDDRFHETYRTFVSWDLTDAVDKLRYRLWPSDRQLDAETWYGRSNDAETEVINEYQSYYYGEQSYGEPAGPENHKEVFTLLIYVRTLMEDVKEIDQNDHNELCTGDIDSIQEWKSDCGDSYLGREIYGGFVLLTVNVDELDSGEQEELYAEFRVDSNVRKKDHRDALNSVDGTITFNFHDILLNGLRRPRAGLLGSGDTMSGADVVTYLTELMEGDGNSYTGYENMGSPGVLYPIEEAGEQEIDIPETGWIIQQDFRDYPLSYIEYCGPPSNGYTCYTDFFANEVQVESLYQEWMQKAEFEYDNKSQYCWGPNPSAAQTRHQQFIADLETCNSVIAQGKTDCEAAFNGGATQSTICDECALPPTCNRERIERMRSQLFEPIRTRPNGNCYDNHGPISGGNDKVLDDTDDSICVLSQVGGKFAGTSESVELNTAASGSGGGPAWYLSASSNHTAANTNTYGRAICVPKTQFTNGGSNTWSAESDGDDTYSPPGSANIGITADFSTAVSLNGVSGHYNGGGEWAKIYHNVNQTPDEWWFKGSTNTSTMKTDWTEWGIDSPAGGTVSFQSPAEGEDTARSTDADAFSNGEKALLLDDSDNSICYLIKFQGRFDGRGEWIRIDEGQNSGSWYLRVRGACKKGVNLVAGGCEFDDYKRVEAQVKCYEFDQG